MRVPAIGFGGAALLGALAPAAAGAEGEEIVPGADYEVVEIGDARAHLVALDLTSSEIAVDATPSGARGQRASALAEELGADIALTGGPFSPLDFSPRGVAIGEGEEWPDSDPGAGAASLWFEKPGLLTEAILTPAGAASPAPIGEGFDAAVAGELSLVEEGEARGEFECELEAIPCERAPRAAAALADAGRAMWWVAVDGWSPASPGLTAPQLAEFLADRGAGDAVLLETGSAPTLYAAPLGGVVSAPSDGEERRAASHLVASFEELEPGELTVLVREEDPFDTGADLEGAEVELDAGEVGVTDERGEVRFETLRPRRVCATADASGFEPAEACRQVPPGTPELLAIALEPEGGTGSATGAPSSAETVGPATSRGCGAAPGRLQDGGARATLGLALAGLLATAVLRRRGGSRRRHQLE